MPTAVDQRSACKLTPEGSLSVWSIMWSPSSSTQRSMNSSYLTDSIDLGVLNIPGGPCITPYSRNHTDGLSVERDNFMAALSFPEKHVELASMKIKNFVAVRAGVAGKFSKAFNNPRSSAAEAMLVLKLAKDVLQVMVFGEIIYEDYSKRGENLRLMAKGKARVLRHKFPRPGVTLASFFGCESLMSLSTPQFQAMLRG